MDMIEKSHSIFAESFDKPIEDYALKLSKTLSDGSICIPINSDEQDKLKDSKFFTVVCDVENYTPQPFVAHNNMLYLHRYFNYETCIIDKIRELNDYSKTVYEIRKNKLKDNIEFLEQLFGVNTSTEIDWQLIASINSYLNNFTIITGGPGTGKTHTVSLFAAFILSLNPDTRIAISAPTGKAAARLTDTLKNFSNTLIREEVIAKINNTKASTIHRLLGGYKRFTHNKDRLLQYDIIIVDESSMIDVGLMSKFMQAVSPETRLIMLGDWNQLSSVEAGSIFGDMCMTRNKEVNAFSPKQISVLNTLLSQKFKFNIANNLNMLTDNIIELLKTRRFDKTKGIGKFSDSVINGNYNEAVKFFNKEDNDTQLQIFNFEEFDLANPDSEISVLVKGFKEYQEEKDIKIALEKLNKVKVLCAVKLGNFGVYKINKLIEKELGISAKYDSFYDNQPIMVTNNNYDFGLFNGDVGIIRADENEIKHAYFNIEGELQKISLVNISEYETAYAMTIHKSQGSEYDNVAVILPPNSQNQILCRELLYTAVTRAKNKCIVYSDEEVLKAAVSKKVNRASGITSRLITLQ